jgi:hypothetical protein
VARRECTAGGRAGIAGSDAEQGFYFLGIGNAAIENALIVLTENLGCAFHLGLGAFDFQVMVAEVSPDVQGGLEEFQVFVEGAKEFVDAPSQSDSLFHSIRGSETSTP